MYVVQMQAAYDDYNDHARSSGKSRGHFIVDLCRPGHLTLCLRNFQERIRCNDDNWDAQFGEMEAQLGTFVTAQLAMSSALWYSTDHGDAHGALLHTFNV